MSVQRLADAAIVTPFHVPAGNFNGHGGSTSAASTSRAPSGKVRPRPQRHEKPEEERFTVGIGANGFRTMVSSRRRNGRQDRRDDRYMDDIPSYPPPSFLEATSTASLAFYPTDSSISSHLPAPEMSVAQLSNRSDDSQQTGQPALSSAPSASGSSDSASFEQVDLSVEFPSQQEVPSYQWPNDKKVKIHTDHTPEVASHIPPSIPPSGNRTPSPGHNGRSTDADNAETELGSAATTPKRRGFSLSPLRTLFPVRSMNMQDRALPRNSPNGPYQFSSPFFKSTTSVTPYTLASPATASPTRSDTRKLFNHKGKERAKSLSLDDWEFLVEEDIPSIDSWSEHAQEKLLQAKQPKSPSHSQTLGPESPRTPSITHPSSRTIPQRDASISSPHSQSQLAQSRLDKKSPPPPFVSRSVRRNTQPAPQSPPFIPSPPAQSSPTSTSPRNRKTVAPLSTLSPRKSTQVLQSSPLGKDSMRPDDGDDSHSGSILQRALEVPLPQTPVDPPQTDVLRRKGSPATCDSGSQKKDLKSSIPSLSGSLASSLQSLKSPEMPSSLDVDTKNLLHDDDSPTRQARDGTLSPSAIDDTASSRHHYPGRPLPRLPPPQLRAMIDSIYASYDVKVPASAQSEVSCPEGVLVELDDNSTSTHAESGKSTPSLTDEECSQPNSGPQTRDTSTDSPRELYDDTELYSHTPSEPASTVSTIKHPLSLSRSNGTADIAEIQALLASLNDQAQDRSDVEAYSPILDHSTPNSPLHDTYMDTPGNRTSFNGHIDIHRRRTLRDGRVKLKISLCDITVDKCGLCLKQFRQGEAAELNTVCKHAFHQLCLKRRGLERQCPVCPEVARSNAYSR